MLLGYLQRKGWRLLYPPQRGRRWACKRWGWTYCTVGKIITQKHLRETYFHNVIGALMMELFGFPFSKQAGCWQRPNPYAYRVMAMALPLGGWARREVNGTRLEAIEALWRTQYIKRRNHYCCRRVIAFVVDWLARVLWLIEVHGRPPIGKHLVYGTLAQRYEVWGL